MNDRFIITLPVAPYSSMFVGKMTTPILVESLLKYINSMNVEKRNYFMI